MKLRVDLLKHLKAKDIAEAAAASVHRFKPEPLFSQTGTGSLSSASTEERAREVGHSTALTRKLERRARRSGKGAGAGDRVQTLRGSARGVIVRLLEDGRVVWRPEGVGGELVTLPEALRMA